MNTKKYFCLIFVLLVTATHSYAARILAAFVFPGKSHSMMYNAIVKELLNRGHEVTLITNFPIGKDLGSNYTEVAIPVYNFMKDIQDLFRADNHFDLTSMSMMSVIKMLDIIGAKSTEHALKQPNVQEIFNRTDTTDVYDLLLVSQFYQEAFLVLGLKYNIPVVTSSTLGYENYMSHMMGVIQPWSFVPHVFLPFDDKMNFWERVVNTFASLYEDFHREYLYFPKQDALVQKYLSHLPIEIPKVSAMERNVSVILLNSHVPLTTPRPSMLGMVPVGGLHIYPPKPLPADIKKFLDGATHGAVYFSLGSNIQSADMPPEKLKIFLEVFESMKQRVLWKFEADKIPKLPENVMVQKWMPQSDILAHPNVKVFITHGGVFGSQEGAHYGVPMLGMPFFCDQYLNINKATKAGYAITLSLPEMTKDNLNHSLNELIENPSYKENIKRVSKIFRDRPISARDTAVYWIEYVIRHKGAPHIRSAGLDLAWYEFYLLDVIGLVVLVIGVVVGSVFLIIRSLNIRKSLCFAFAVFLVISYANAARILAVFVFPGKSHFMMHKTLIRELVNRGHEVTFITSDSMGPNLGANYTEVLIPVYEFWPDIQEHFKADNLFELTSLSLKDFLKMLEILGEKTTEHALKQPGVQKIFNRKDTENVYDLLLAEQFYQEAFLVLALKYDIPVVTSSTLGYENFMSQMMGVITPWSFVPHGFLPFDDKMSFWERILNTFSSLYEDYHREFVDFPIQDALIQKYLAHLPMKIPKVTEMEKNISVMLLNSHVPLTTPRPTIQGMVPVGGMHIYPPKPLPSDIKKFLDGATDGAIYFSLGSNVRSADMPPEMLKIFLEVFGSMKQRILWKFENDEIPKLPKNVMVHKWMPQSDILAHPNVKVFITHGGLFGSQEGVHYAVPMLGMPFYCDQYLNMNKATKAGYAITLKFQEITADILKTSLMELIENPSYKKNIQRISEIFRDRPLSARDTAMYWVEYVIRHKGARHIRSAGLDLAWYEFYLLDVIGFIVLGMVAVSGIIFLAVRKLVKIKKIKEKTG